MTAVRWTVQDSKARHRRRRGKKQSGGLFFSAWLVESRNVYRDDCGSVDGTGSNRAALTRSGRGSNQPSGLLLSPRFLDP